MQNLNEHNITDEVVRRFKQVPSPRLQEIMTSLIKHLHEFAREVHLTEDEWFQGIQFVTSVGQKCDDKRQEFILLSDTLGLSQLVVAQNHNRPQGVTEQTVFGPFPSQRGAASPPWGQHCRGGSRRAMFCLGTGQVG